MLGRDEGCLDGINEGADNGWVLGCNVCDDDGPKDGMVDGHDEGSKLGIGDSKTLGVDDGLEDGPANGMKVSPPQNRFLVCSFVRPC